jgi:hypothetical protein
MRPKASAGRGSGKDLLTEVIDQLERPMVSCGGLWENFHDSCGAGWVEVCGLDRGHAGRSGKGALNSRERGGGSLRRYVNGQEQRAARPMQAAGSLMVASSGGVQDHQAGEHSQPRGNQEPAVDDGPSSDKRQHVAILTAPRLFVDPAAWRL